MQDITAIDTYLPRFLHRYPTATIHYRWPQRGQKPSYGSAEPPASPSSSSTHSPSPPPRLPHWPTPIHDTLAGYDFLTRTLTPPPTTTNGQSRHQRRAIYLHGRALGGTLAASLALTESHQHEPMAVRGLLAVNGVYNWTTFLPDHPVHAARLTLQRELLALGVRASLLSDGGLAGGSEDDMAAMEALLPRLFTRPGELFDPFASPVLFFHTAGLMVPPSFSERWRPEYSTEKLVLSPSSSSSSSSSSTGRKSEMDYVYSDPEDPAPPTPFSESAPNTDTNSSSDAADVAAALVDIYIAPPARKGYLAFPPTDSTLKIPDTLLVHSKAPPLLPSFVTSQRKAVWNKFRNAENSFSSQAVGLAGLMRRSVDKLEGRGRMRWDEELQDPEGEARRRVETGEVVDDEEAEEMSRQWFEDHLG